MMTLFRSSHRDGGPLSTPSVIARGMTSGPGGVWAWCTLPTRSTDEIGTERLRALTADGAADLRQVLPKDVEWHMKVQWSRYTGAEHYATEAAKWSRGVPPGVDRYLRVQASRLDQLHLPRRQVLLGVRLDDPSARRSVGSRVLASADTTKDAEARLAELAGRAAKWHARMAATSFNAHPSIVAELAWSLRRDLRRTVNWLPDGPLAGEGETARLRSGEVHVHPDHLRIQTDGGVRFLRCLTNTVTGFPASSMSLPGGEWLRDLVGLDDDPDMQTYPLEVSIRGRSLSSARSNRRISNALKLLKEQGREAAQGVAEEPPEAVLEAREALMERQAELSDGSVSMVEDSPIWLVEADTLDELERRTQETIDAYASRRIELWPAENLQGELWRSTVMGDRLRVQDFAQFRPMGTLVGSWFHGGSAIGEESGPLLGQNIGSTPGPYRARFTDAAQLGQPVTSAFLGQTGSGKSTALMLTAIAEARYGSWVFLLDMKGDLPGCVDVARMFDIPTVSLEADAVNSGSMCPFGYMPVGEKSGMTAEQAVIDLLLMALRRSQADASEPLIRRAVQAVAAYPNPQDRSTYRVIGVLRHSSDPAAKALGEELHDLSQDPAFQPVAGPPAEQRQALPTGPGLVYMRFPGEFLPNRDAHRDEWTPSNRLTMTLLRATFIYATYMANRVKGIPKVVALPELHRITPYDVGRSMVKEVALMGRALDTSQILDTQASLELEQIDGLADQLSCVLAFHVQRPEEAEAQARLLGRAPDPQFIAGQQRLAKGECIARDRQGRIAPVYFDRLAGEIADALDTTAKRDTDREDLAG